MVFETVNPSTQKVISTFEETRDLSAILKHLRDGQKEWQKTSIDRRLVCIEKLYLLLEQEKEKLAEIVTKETGKPILQAIEEINDAKDRIAYFLNNAIQHLQDEVLVEDDEFREKIIYEPKGVIGVIAAWSRPYLYAVNVIIPALLSGNAVMYKPSRFSFLSGLKLQELLYDTGIPENAFKTIIGNGDTAKQILDMPLDAYFVKASHRTGKKIQHKLAHRIVPCHMELSGKDAVFVSKHIENLLKAVKQIARAVFKNNGQSCNSVARIYVHHAIYDRFIEEFLAQIETYKVGDPQKKDTFLGPLIHERQIRLLEEHIEDALEKGAVCYTGGKRIDRDGFYFEPTVLGNANHDMFIMKDESLGPVIGIQKVASPHEAIHFMNDTNFGLASSVFSDIKEEADFVLEQINCGTVYWNCCDRKSPRLSWTGRKNSGTNMGMLHLGIRAFVNPKVYQFRRSEYIHQGE
ncbi:aldehyde dehydrogenase family protein [Sediminitomix flava]|uniref:Acyl-CoA reductase-like NAD-dependent aldehyde dehydrogenase n=1 Tax=Sediminitomix flava TaxID=379075 RepID=A0A315YXB5_SEDFL|nr:aldehyde dehydrogenase family protein [Sediminitomix flava]PWJ34117.1 acyl-CoA reductase-like NAD-dependent aldehyde dehydrogenase [Sediminitomix flava]